MNTLGNPIAPKFASLTIYPGNVEAPTVVEATDDTRHSPLDEVLIAGNPLTARGNFKEVGELCKELSSLNIRNPQDFLTQFKTRISDVVKNLNLNNLNITLPDEYAEYYKNNEAQVREWVSGMFQRAVDDLPNIKPKTPVATPDTTSVTYVSK